MKEVEVEVEVSIKVKVGVEVQIEKEYFDFRFAVGATSISYSARRAAQQAGALQPAGLPSWTCGADDDVTIGLCLAPRRLRHRPHAGSTSGWSAPDCRAALLGGVKAGRSDLDPDGYEFPQRSSH